MLDPRWWIVSVPSLITNDFVMTSLLSLKIILLVYFLILLQTPFFNFISLYDYFEGNLDFPVKFSNMTSK